MYNIQQVSQIEDEFSDEIHFTIDNFPFSIIVYKPRYSRSTNQLRSVFHETKERCPFCDEEFGYHENCSELHEDLDSLFQQLISTNSLRLPWLYREYEVMKSDKKRSGNNEHNV